MDTSDGGGNGPGICGDCSVGTIVWVRRRNGSWWPGRVLGLDELSASHLMSPRSGTPVKLLGREDASVDWYNLEKSKRVKKFRCGEFDTCIERAEASQSIPIKKRVKYARREDAILHALELEKQQKLEAISNGISCKIIGAHKGDVLSSPKSYIRLNEPAAHGKLSSHMCENFLKKVAFSHEVEDIDDPLHLLEGKAHQKFSLEYDNAEVIPRMRGFQDFGLQTVQTKRKRSLSTSSEKSLDNHVEYLSSSDYIIEGADQASTSRNAVSVRRKRSYGGVIEEFIVKKRDRRRPLVQVLQSSVKLPPSCSFQPSCSITGTINKKETEKIVSTCQAKRSRCVYLPADPEGQDYGDRLEQSMLEETDMLADTAVILSKDCDPPELQVSGEFSSLIQEDVPLTAFMSRLNGPAKGVSFNASVSKWRMKGKRNIRNVGKRLIDAVDVKTCRPDLERSNASINSTHDVKERSLHFGQTKTSSQRVLKAGFYPIKEPFELESAYDESDLIERDLDQNQLTVYGNTRNQRSLHDSDEDSHGFAHNTFLGEPADEADPQLVDVDLKVQLSYQGEHVPLVSLMSRFYGKAVIGHPIQIEILEDGSANQLIVLAHNVVMDEDTAPQAMWWTARRTTMHRVPRSIPSTVVLEKEEDVHPLHKKACYHHLNHQVNSAKKLQNKNAKRLSLSSRKTIKLSSLASNEKLAGESVGHELVGSNTILGGSVPLVTCVPVKVVFSRVLEALDRPSPAFARHIKTGSPGTQGQ